MISQVVKIRRHLHLEISPTEFSILPPLQAVVDFFLVIAPEKGRRGQVKAPPDLPLGTLGLVPAVLWDGRGVYVKERVLVPPEERQSLGLLLV